MEEYIWKGLRIDGDVVVVVSIIKVRYDNNDDDDNNDKLYTTKM